MKLLKSRRGIPIPKVFFVSDRSEIKSIPLGVPYFYGDAEIEEAVIQMLEYELLFQRAKATKLPLNFEAIMKKEGYYNADFDQKEQMLGKLGLSNKEAKMSTESGYKEFANFMKGASYYVDIGVLKSLKIMPVWMESLEQAITVNTTNFVEFDHNMYSKKLDGIYGGVKLKSPERNLIIIDISGSIPRNVSKTCLILAKNLSESFYADILITGSKSTLYTYEEIEGLDVSKVYDENETDNDQTYFKRLLSGSERKYNTLIVFGDEDSPNWPWYNNFNNNSKEMDDEQGQELNKWTVNKIVSFHTSYEYLSKHYPEEPEMKKVAAYGRWFKCEDKNISHMEDWVYTLRG